MSARARVKLCSGLAKIGWLSKRKFQSIFPKITRVEITSAPYSVILEGAISKKIIAFPSLLNCELKAGDVLRVSSENYLINYDNFNWKIVFFVGEEKISVAGKCAGVGSLKSADGTSLKRYENFSESVFLIPTGEGFFFTEELQQAFGLLRNNENVGTYPNCRRWSKD